MALPIYQVTLFVALSAIVLSRPSSASEPRRDFVGDATWWMGAAIVLICSRIAFLAVAGSIEALGLVVDLAPVPAVFVRGWAVVILVMPIVAVHLMSRACPAVHGERALA